MKGAYEKAVYIKNTRSPYFAEAILILRPGSEVDMTDMLAEAQRLVDNYSAKFIKKEQRRKKAKFIYPICLIMLAVALTVFVLTRS